MTWGRSMTRAVNRAIGGVARSRGAPVGAVMMAVALACLAVAPSPVHAADKSHVDKARAHYDSGNAYFNLEKYKEALDEYEQGFVERQDPSFLFNIAQCHRLMGHKPEAIRF